MIITKKQPIVIKEETELNENNLENNKHSSPLQFMFTEERFIKDFSMNIFLANNNTNIETPLYFIIRSEEYSNIAWKGAFNSLIKNDKVELSSYSLLRKIRNDLNNMYNSFTVKFSLLQIINKNYENKEEYQNPSINISFIMNFDGQPVSIVLLPIIKESNINDYIWFTNSCINNSLFKYTWHQNQQNKKENRVGYYHYLTTDIYNKIYDYFLKEEKKLMNQRANKQNNNINDTNRNSNKDAYVIDDHKLIKESASIAASNYSNKSLTRDPNNSKLNKNNNNKFNDVTDTTDIKDNHVIKNISNNHELCDVATRNRVFCQVNSDINSLDDVNYDINSIDKELLRKNIITRLQNSNSKESSSDEKEIFEVNSYHNKDILSSNNDEINSNFKSSMFSYNNNQNNNINNIQHQNQDRFIGKKTRRISISEINNISKNNNANNNSINRNMSNTLKTNIRHYNDNNNNLIHLNDENIYKNHSNNKIRASSVNSINSLKSNNHLNSQPYKNTRKANVSYVSKQQNSNIILSRNKIKSITSPIYSPLKQTNQSIIMKGVSNYENHTNIDKKDYNMILEYINKKSKINHYKDHNFTLDILDKTQKIEYNVNILKAFIKYYKNVISLSPNFSINFFDRLSKVVFSLGNRRSALLRILQQPILYRVLDFDENNFYVNREFYNRYYKNHSNNNEQVNYRYISSNKLVFFSVFCEIDNVEFNFEDLIIKLISALNTEYIAIYYISRYKEANRIIISGRFSNKTGFFKLLKCMKVVNNSNYIVRSNKNSEKDNDVFSFDKVSYKISKTKDHKLSKEKLAVLEKKKNIIDIYWTESEIIRNYSEYDSVVNKNYFNGENYEYWKTQYTFLKEIRVLFAEFEGVQIKNDMVKVKLIE